MAAGHPSLSFADFRVGPRTPSPIRLFNRRRAPEVRPSGRKSRPRRRIAELDCARGIVEMPANSGGSLMRKLIVLAAAMSALLVASCNTVEGVGKDVQAAGKAVTNTAHDVKK
jgi:predicted small secreted protein